MNYEKRGQVWIETVIYTMIAFILIGLVLAYAKPKLEETRDKIIIENSVEMLQSMNQVVLSIFQMGPGNKRKVEVGIKKGELIINGLNDSITYEVEGSYVYTEPGLDVKIGEIISHTQDMGRLKKVNLTLDYNDFNITFEGEDRIKSLGKASAPYKIFFTNKGINSSINPNKTIINVEIE